METALSFPFDERGIEKIYLDSREDGRGGLFVPIIGAHKDGHDFIEMAVERGAAAVLSSRDVTELKKKYPEVRFWQVPDTRAALQEIGRYERERFRGKVIGVTGSSGKTTMRSMLALALSSERRVFQTAGNANSQLGVPITLFQLARSGAEIAALELGMSEPGEMTRIASIARVDLALITNIGTAHIENLKTKENILLEKLHILDGAADGAALYLNGEDPLLASLTEERIHDLGISAGRRVELHFYRAKEEIPLSAAGHHMQQNAAAALAVSLDLGLQREGVLRALRGFSGLKGRGEKLLSRSGIGILDDSYNASPDALKASLLVLSKEEGRRKIALLSDMLELGERSEELHEDCGAFLSSLPIDRVLLYGEKSLGILRGIRREEKRRRDGRQISVSHFSNAEELYRELLREAAPGDLVLFKGSHSMGLSRLVERFREE